MEPLWGRLWFSVAHWWAHSVQDRPPLHWPRPLTFNKCSEQLNITTVRFNNASTGTYCITRSISTWEIEILHGAVMWCGVKNKLIRFYVPKSFSTSWSASSHSAASTAAATEFSTGSKLWSLPHGVWDNMSDRWFGSALCCWYKLWVPLIKHQSC